MNLPFHGRTEMDHGEVRKLSRKFFLTFFSQDDEDAEEAEEESDGGEPDDEMDAQQGSASPGASTNIPPQPLDV